MNEKKIKVILDRLICPTDEMCTAWDDFDDVDCYECVLEWLEGKRDE